MSRQASRKKSKISVKAGMFWGAIVLITVGFLIGIIVIWAQNSKVATSYNDVEHLQGREIFEQTPLTDGTYSYYVFIYGSNSNEAYTDKVNDMEEMIVKYQNFILDNPNNDSVINLYAYNCDDPNNNDLLVDGSTNISSNFALLRISKNDAPVLLRITVTVASGERSVTVNQRTSINTELNDVMRNAS